MKRRHKERNQTTEQLCSCRQSTDNKIRVDIGLGEGWEGRGWRAVGQILGDPKKRTSESFTLSLPRSHQWFSLLCAIKFLWCFLFREFGIGSTDNLFTDIFLGIPAVQSSTVSQNQSKFNRSKWTNNICKQTFPLAQRRVAFGFFCMSKEILPRILPSLCERGWNQLQQRTTITWRKVFRY